METIEEHPVISSSIDNVKTQIHGMMPTDNTNSNVCHKSNGVDGTQSDENMIIEQVTQKNILDTNPSETVIEQSENEKNELEDKYPVLEGSSEVCETDIAIETINATTDISNQLVIHEHQQSADKSILNSVEVDNEVKEEINESDVNLPCNNDITNLSIDEKQVELETLPSEGDRVDEEAKREGGDLGSSSSIELCNLEYVTLINEGVHFETEVLIEKNDNDVNENVVQIEDAVNKTVSTSHNNILSELGDNIELTEVLQSSNISETTQNNNSTGKVFNKEELLDILEGKDVPESQTEEIVMKDDSELIDSDLETQKAIKQLTMLQKKGRRRTLKKEEKDNTTIIKKTSIEPSVLSKRRVIRNKDKDLIIVKETIETVVIDNEEVNVDNEPAVVPIPEKDKNIVNELVMDWEDDELTEANNKELKTTESMLVSDSENALENIENNDVATGKLSVDLSISQEQNQSKSNDDAFGKRRLSRVIKKKVIYDPDNPDTFTKNKTHLKTKETPSGDEQLHLKKAKVEYPIIEQRKSRSPAVKLQWKKPNPRNSKQHKRLSEVDKLLMDEGAVNMIYQLTPEAPKGRKNMKTKAEFIKKLQSSTPDGKEMKFRERKKEAKYEDGEAKKLLGGKHRPSLSNSVKSPTVSEDYETHSADDSIIYRRHSSSSYSSSCMSPRRLSDVEGTSQSTKPQQIHSQPADKNKSDELKDQSQETTFLSEDTSHVVELKSDLINKEDCLSLKEKLNTKLSLALNKRKRESIKPDKPAKQKKINTETKELNDKESSGEFKFVSIKIDQHLAEICLKRTGLKDSIEVFNEIKMALIQIDEKPGISVTLLSSQCGTLCSSLDLSVLLDDNSEFRHKNAYDLADSVRSLLAAVSCHTKLLCCGVWGACSGPAVSVVALCDLALASECATFALAVPAAPPLPGAAALTAPHRALTQSLVNDLVVLGRRISASEAFHSGLISRTLWPDRFDEQVRNIVRDIALAPPQGTLLKKRLLSLKKSGEAETSFLKSLESERDLLVEYWTSEEGQALLRSALDAA